MENHTDFEKLAHVIQHGPRGSRVKTLTEAKHCVEVGLLVGKQF